MIQKKKISSCMFDKSFKTYKTRVAENLEILTKFLSTWGEKHL